MARHERWTAIVSAGLILGALLACKKKGSEATSEASASAAAVAPAPPPPAQTAVPVETPKLGDVKRYADKEKKLDESAVRVLGEDIKVFNEADSKTAEVATLPKNALVFRLAEVEGFQLVEFPSGVGQFSQGWVEKAGVSEKAEKVAREAVLSDKKAVVAKVKTDGGVAAAASGSAAASASAVASASASAKPLTDAEKLKEAEKRAAEAEKLAAEETARRKAAEKRNRELRREAAKK